ncbi:MAG: copper-binding protein [Zoogloeaceae bacterium]|nr:copper-binding protein [Zoogloeaceae bacterium]
MRLTPTLVALASMALLSAKPILAADTPDAHHGDAAAVASEAGEFADGTVKKVDKAAGKLTISHGPLAALDMPPMTMVFRAGDAGMLDRVKAGDKIRFVAERSGGIFTVTTLELVP